VTDADVDAQRLAVGLVVGVLLATAATRLVADAAADVVDPFGIADTLGVY
jgi:hypothetical protein